MMDERTIKALAKSLVPFLNERLAEATAPLTKRVEELEEAVRRLLQRERGNG